MILRDFNFSAKSDIAYSVEHMWNANSQGEVIAI